MADSGGYWLNLAEAQKLSQSELMAGVVDIAPKRGGILTELPVRQVMGTSVKWNRSNTRRAANRTGVGSQLTWTDNVDYTQMESTLKVFYDQTPLNKFVRDIYGTINNYQAQQLLELRRGVIETLNDALIYDDSDYNSVYSAGEMDGLHHWAIDNTGTDGAIDEGEGALSIMHVRNVLDYALHGVDFMLMSFAIASQIDAFYQEGAGTANVMGRVIYTPNQMGLPGMMWGGIPILRSDYMVSEQVNTGHTSNARAKYSSGTAQYSILFVKRGGGSMQTVDPGAVMTFGGDTMGGGEFFRGEYFDKLENYDAAGIRLTSYFNMYVGAPRGVLRIDDLTNAIPTA